MCALQNDERSASEANRSTVIFLARSGRWREGVALARSESKLSGDKWLSAAIVDAMTHRDLTFAGELAEILTHLRRGTATYPADDLHVTRDSLHHDIEQLRYLVGQGEDWANELLEIHIAAEAHILTLPDMRLHVSDDMDRRFGKRIGRIHYKRQGQRLPHALSKQWPRTKVEKLYKSGTSGVVVIDDVLTQDALSALQAFCLESTIWTRNQFSNGRLGSIFFEGFNCPLVLQIAEELRWQLEEIIGEQHPLRQLWGFKNTKELPSDSTIHADFAAVNVNIWITPTEANHDPSCGGMQIYTVEAPPSWNFESYNRDPSKIWSYLAAVPHQVIRVPYRCNRAIVFNSDLFHATEAVRFAKSYSAHRINVTMLYGDRLQEAITPLDLSSRKAKSAAFSPFNGQ